MKTLTEKQLETYLNIADLSQTSGHAINLMVDVLCAELGRVWCRPVNIRRLPPIVDIADNYDNLGYTPDAITRSQVYTHYVDEHTMLRSHTSAHIPHLLRTMVGEDMCVAAPGICYRRDCVDRTHVGTPHQVDVWRVRKSGPPLGEHDLQKMVATVVNAVLPGATWYCPPSSHPYTSGGREIYVCTATGDIEIGECGIAALPVLTRAGLAPSASGLAMGLGLDRLVMLRKNITDIRILRSDSEHIRTQMYDLEPYRAVSSHPVAKRDISIAVVGTPDGELLGDSVRQLLCADMVENVRIVSTTAYGQLPDVARKRLGMCEGMVNVLLSLELRSVDKTLTADEANTVRDEVYAALHQGGPGMFMRAPRTSQGPDGCGR